RASSLADSSDVLLRLVIAPIVAWSALVCWFSRLLTRSALVRCILASASVVTGLCAYGYCCVMFFSWGSQLKLGGFTGTVSGIGSVRGLTLTRPVMGSHFPPGSGP